MVGLYTAVKGGHSDPECTHVIVSKGEYDELLSDKRDAEREVIRVKEDAGKAIAKVRAEAEKNIRDAKAEAEQEIERQKKLAQIERSGKEYQRELNENLIRIARERANADRQIKPKKERAGYVVLSSRQKKYRYKRDRNHWDEVLLWETVIQTPYSVEFSAEQAMTESAELFARDESGNWLVGRLGLDFVYNGRYEDLISDAKFVNWQNYNVIIEKIYNANGKVGYWEIVLTHTLPLDNITAEL